MFVNTRYKNEFDEKIIKKHKNSFIKLIFI